MRDRLPGMSIYHMVPLEANTVSHYFKQLQTLQVFCNNIYCLIRTLKTGLFCLLTNIDLSS